MVYKIPIYLEIKVEDDFDPGLLSEGVEKFLVPALQKVVKTNGAFPWVYPSFFGDRDVEKLHNHLKIKGKISVDLIPKSEVFKKVVKQ